tara:strand:+ start:2415 stop:3140 length:726 start_codon:yes stop_codon:yes gene_type:complete
MFKNYNIIYITLFLIILLNFIIFYNFFYIECFTNNKSLTFSNTEKWGSKELDMKHNYSDKGKYLLNNVSKIPFYDNNSNYTQQEINDILQKQTYVDENKIHEIEKEIYLDYIFFKFDLDYNEKHQFNQIFNNDINYVIMNLKHQYNRVRPYILDENVQTFNIEKPKHPSYPSGHSTQSYFIANLMTEKYPENKKQYFLIADEIATNREYAGFHYKSDTEYGKIIASEMAEYYSNDNNPLLY